MVTSLLPQFTARLLAETSLKGQGPLANYDRPLAAAAHLDFARLIEALEPWIDYGMTLDWERVRPGWSRRPDRQHPATSA